MLDNDKKALIALSGKKEICILPAMANRHGLICGATGTGKSVSLQTMAETFSSRGVPVFLADVKGDLSGMAMPGKSTGKLADRVRELDLEAKGYKRRGFPVCFWDVFGKEGHPLRTTISELGPLLLSRLLGLNDVQSGVLQIVFRIADDSGLLLLDLKDLRSMLAHVGEERDQYKKQYGQISPASVGAIQRALLGLEEEGGDRFFGEPALDVENLLKCDKDGLGIINILSADALINAPQLYSCVLLWLLSDLFEHLPEVGDCPKPRLVFFFDEAHLLFDGITPVLLQKIEQVARLIRSRGVGIFFVTQNPSDVPDSVLGQLGNRVEHALRAFTPKEQQCGPRQAPSGQIRIFPRKRPSANLASGKPWFHSWTPTERRRLWSGLLCFHRKGRLGRQAKSKGRLYSPRRLLPEFTTRLLTGKALTKSLPAAPI